MFRNLFSLSTAIGLFAALLPWSAQPAAIAQTIDGAAESAPPAAVSADFGSRTYTTYPIPQGLLGAEHFDTLYTQADVDTVAAAGFTTARFWAQIPVVFKTTTPNWTAIDPAIARIQAAGVHVLLQLTFSPPWLQPGGTVCKNDKQNAFPTNVASWAQIARQYVAHMDAKFPGVVTDYEIWNEPNTGALCDATSTKESDYLKLYAAAAPAMKQQAALDHASVRVGGPATAGIEPDWVTKMTTYPTLAPYVDFVSYHFYLYSSSQVAAQWDTTVNNIPSVYSRTQGSSGPGGLYLYASNLIKAGKQPGGAHTPIYDSEYNLNWAFAKNCCSNDFTYSPVWNGLYVLDMLDQVYQGATQVPSKLVYFGANAHPYFCLIGEIDTNMDCYYPMHVTPQPYPQYFLYQMLGSSKYLDLVAGGYMARSISPSLKSNGLVVTAFYTPSQDSIVIVNPFGTAFNATVTLANTGYSSASATLYSILNGRSIQGQSLSLKHTTGTSYTAAVSVGPYSVQSIAIK
jgi:hypothetical protein